MSVQWISDYEEEQLKREMAQAMVNPSIQIMYMVTQGTTPAQTRHNLAQRLSGYVSPQPPTPNDDDQHLQ